MKKFIKNILKVKKLNLDKKAEYLLLISKLLKNGFSLSQAINCLRLLENDNDVFKKIHMDLQGGALVSQALRHLQLPTVVFNQLVIAQEHGKIALALEQTGKIMQSQAKQKNKFKELLAYPSFILLFLLTMLVGMKIYIIPQLDIASGKNSINLFLGLISISTLLAVLCSFSLLLYLRKLSEYQKAILLVKLPVIGKIYLNFFQFLILQGLGMQLASGMNLFDICESNNRFQNGSIQMYLSNKFVERLNMGKSIFDLIDDEPLLPNQLKIILQTGEDIEQLSQDLLLISELKFEETKKHLKSILNLVQPILFAIIAMVIIVTYLIVLMPIYGMMKGMS